MSFPLPLGHAFVSHAHSRTLHDHTGFVPYEGDALRRFQGEILSRWSEYVKPSGVMDVPTDSAVKRIQHAMIVTQTGRLDESVWDYAHTHAP